MDQDTTENIEDGSDDATLASDVDETLIDTDGSASVGPEGTRKLPESHPLRQGTDLSGAQLGEYRLVRKIAKGGMGEVYEGVQLALDRRVAIKIIAEELVSDPSFLQRFEREAKSSAALNHPNVAQVYDFGKDGDRHFLVMEYVEGVDLSQHVKEHGPLSIAEGISVARQVASALKFALNQSIIHRDIKPANLLWTPDKTVKITDLGLAKKLSEESDVTMTGTGIGSPHYLAPEQADDARGVDHRADIYALGISLLYLLTGKRPFDGESAFAVVLAHANKPLPSSADLGTQLPSEFEAMIRRMAAKDPDDRHPDYDAVLEDIARITASLPPGTIPGQETDFIEKPKNSLNAILISIVGAAAIILILIAAFKKGEVHGTKVDSSASTASAPPQRAEISSHPAANASSAPADHPKPEPGPPPGPNGWPLDERYRPAVLKLLPEVEPISETPLPDSDLDSMLKLADDYAKENAEEYTQILARYNQVMGKAKGGPRFEEISAMHDAWFKRAWDAELKAVEEFETQMHTAMRSGTPHLGVAVWKDFPKNLRSEGLNLYLAEFLLKHTPPNYLWDLTYNQVGMGAARGPLGNQGDRPGLNRPAGRRPGGKGPRPGSPRGGGFQGPNSRPGQ